MGLNVIITTIKHQLRVAHSALISFHMLGLEFVLILSLSLVVHICVRHDSWSHEVESCVRQLEFGVSATV